MESTGEKKKKRRKRKGETTIADEQPSTLGVPNFKKTLGLQESLEVITKHSTEGIHQWHLWLQDGRDRLLRLLLHRPCLHPTLSTDSRYSTLQALSSAGWLGPLLPALSGYEVFLVLDKPLGCSDSLLEFFQLPLQKFESLGAHRGISLGIQSRILIVDQSALFGNISF
jgi:hypothetical protein